MKVGVDDEVVLMYGAPITSGSFMMPTLSTRATLLAPRSSAVAIKNVRFPATSQANTGMVVKSAPIARLERRKRETDGEAKQSTKQTKKKKKRRAAPGTTNGQFKHVHVT